MSDRTKSPALTRTQHKRKERILTQPEPAKVRESTTAVVLKHGGVFLLAQENGDVPWKRPHGYGLFYEDCRFLDGYTLTLNGEPLTVLSSSDVRGFRARHELTNPVLPGIRGNPDLSNNSLAVRRERIIRGGVLHERITVCNYGQRSVSLALELCFRARFEDMFVLKGFVRGPRGKVHEPVLLSDCCVELRYVGIDGFNRTTSIAFSQPPDVLEPRRACFRFSLNPGNQWALGISITPSEHREEPTRRHSAEPVVNLEQRAHWLECAERVWLEHSARVRSSNALFDRVLRRALLDLRLLRSRLHGKQYFAAGIPWFATLFGRDALTVAIQVLPYRTDVARQTLQLLAHYQARKADSYRDAEPGKILHEFRTGELAQANAIPQSPAYYGTVDATLLFLILAAEYVNWTGDLALVRRLLPNLQLALEWTERYANHGGLGYVDYPGAEYARGRVNQGWKDAGNSIVNADGSFPDPPIALCEVQAYLYRALRQMAEVFEALGEQDQAGSLNRRADDLRARFERDFWSEKLGCYVLALQQGGRPCEVVSSNAGQVLWGGIASPERAARVAERLMAEDMFSGWGIRTLSSRETTYNPISYHLGSVWPHDNGIITGGLRRYGHDAEALRVFDAMFEAAASLPNFRMPELYCGYPRGDQNAPVRYPVACSPQAWAAGSIPHALWNLLGLHARALSGRLIAVRPRLPAWLDWLEVENLRVGDARLTLRFDRTGNDGLAEVTSNVHAGNLRVDRFDDVDPGQWATAME